MKLFGMQKNNLGLIHTSKLNNFRYLTDKALNEFKLEVLMESLEKILSFAGLNTEEEVKNHFYKVSDYLFSNVAITSLKFGSFNITDLELYLYNNKDFKDPFMTARHHTQLTSGHFYVHRSKKNHKLFKQPNFIGLDITCGDAFSCYGGLLIRAIKNIETGEEINGCAKVLNHLISGPSSSKLISKKWSNEELSFLKEVDDSSVQICSTFHLTEISSLNFDHIYIGERDHGQEVELANHQLFNSYKLKTVSPLKEKIPKKFEKQLLAQQKLKAA